MAKKTKSTSDEAKRYSFEEYLKEFAPRSPEFLEMEEERERGQNGQRLVREAMDKFEDDLAKK